MPKKHKKNIIGWEEIVGNNPVAYRRWFKAEKDFFKENIKKDAMVLEVGCGDGRSLNDILPITKNIIGVDNDATAVRHAKSNFKNYPSVKIVLAEGKKLPFKSKMFDYVTCVGTFANFGPEKFAILAEMKRVLKGNGKIIISVYSEDALTERLKAYKKISADIKEIKKDGTVVFNDFGADGISEQFSKRRLISIFNKVKLELEKIKKTEIGYICLLSL